jgi:hypothetical protein
MKKSQETTTAASASHPATERGPRTRNAISATIAGRKYASAPPNRPTQK